MTQLEKLEALLDEMGVWYEREDRGVQEPGSKRISGDL